MNNKSGFFKFVFPKVSSDYPVSPEAEIHARHDDTYHRLTPKFTEPELDGYINDLVKELEQIRKEGKSLFALARNQI